MSETYELKAEVRDGVGKGAARAVRRKGKIPAVIYGDRKPPIPISLDRKELTLKLHAGGFLTHVMNLSVGGEQIRVIPKDYQLDPVKDSPVHVDFLRIGEGTLLTVDIPVHFINEEAAPGIKRGGALNIVRHAIELYVPANAIPEEIVVDLTGLDIGDSVHISHVTLPEGVRPTITDRDFTIATIAGAGGAAADEAAEAEESNRRRLTSAWTPAGGDRRMLLLVGLGNPGRRYAGNRHNIGFMAADEVHRSQTFSAWRARFEGEVSEGLLGGVKAYLLKPATFMNESGRSVGQAMRFHKLSPADIVVIHDELDLPPGKLRLKTGGGHGGHNGLKSIEAHIGKDFRRMRLGIGHPGRKELVNGYVLHDFARSDQDWVRPLVEAVAANAPLLAKSDDATFMNRVHLALAEADEVPAPAKPARDAGRSPLNAERGVGGAFADGLKKLFGRQQ